MEQFIVELLAGEDGPPYKRSPAMSKEEAEKLLASHSVEGIYPRIVPAEKYAFKGIQQRVDKPEETAPNEYRSRVE